MQSILFVLIFFALNLARRHGTSHTTDHWQKRNGSPAEALQGLIIPARRNHPPWGASACAAQGDLLEVPVDGTRPELAHGAQRKRGTILLFRRTQHFEAAVVVDDAARQGPHFAGLINAADADVVDTCDLIFIKYAPDKAACTASEGCL